MSIAQASLAVSAGQTYTQYVGSAQTVGAVVVLNESPYGLNVSNGSSSQWIAAQTADLVPCDSPAFSGALNITTDGYLSNAADAPSYLVLFTAYAPGEAIRGSYPAALVRLIGGSVSTTQAQQIINTTNADGSQIIQAAPSGGSGTYVSVNNDGTLDWYVALGGLLDAGHKQHIFSIANNVSTPPQQLQFFAPIGVSAPPILTSGNQETGVAGYTGYAPGAGNGLNFIFNFKTVMTNTPTSLTSSNLSTPTNANSLGFNLITKYGANMFWSATAAGISTWAVQYTTVGNCLLAFDAQAQTLDHHCEGCGAVHRGVALAALDTYTGVTPNRSGLAYTCPDCGTSEHFNCGLTSVDEADATPQGTGDYQTTRGAQAALIRALQTALGLPVQP